MQLRKMKIESNDFMSQTKIKPTIKVELKKDGINERSYISPQKTIKVKFKKMKNSIVNSLE